MSSNSGILTARPLLGCSAMVLNTLLIPIMGVVIKQLANDGVTTLDMLLWRSVLVIALVGPFVLLPQNRQAIVNADFRAHTVHAAFTVSSMACFYYALRTLPIVTVTAINFTTPFFVLMLSSLFFKERVSFLGWCALVVGFLGALIALRPEISGIGMAEIVVLLGSILAAGTALSVRRMPARSSNFATIFYLSLFGALIYGVIGVPAASLPSPPQFLWACLLAGIALAVHTSIVLAYRFGTSMLIGALDYLRVFSATIIGYIFLGEQPDLIDCLGIALIIISGALILRASMQELPSMHG